MNNTNIELFTKFINKYGARYERSKYITLDDYKEGLKNDYLNYPQLIKEGNRNDVIDQICYILNFFKKSENPYIAIADFIEEVYGLNHNILEIGGGYIPAFAIEVARRQKITGGNITVMDPKLFVTKLNSNIILKREFFTSETDISNYDLIVGIKPCAASQTLIESAKNNDKDFIIFLCDCVWHMYESAEEMPTVNQWYNYIKDICDFRDPDMHESKLDDSYNYKTPIYYKTKHISK